MSFDTVLIANRGAIATRIIRTLKAMGLRSVAVYSEADADSLHVSQADEAVCIGGARASESYLNVAAILDAARKTGAGAIHPGYGFLAENAEFAEACADAGIVFIGPTPENMRTFGLKHSARELAAAHGVPLAPGTNLLTDENEAANAAQQIGFPIMLKATAGGGGIGMRVCEDEASVREGFATVARQGLGNFGDAGVFLERYIRSARHIEVQIFGDGCGKVVALGERDCSLQRRNQKVVEEAPAPLLPAAVRADLIAAAIRLGQAAYYRSAGTVEFLYDSERQEFFFLEMNTRLQVEHPVTEAITGIDLVEQMIRVAYGEKLAMTQDDIKIDGWAIENRVYAEDPYRGFLPSTGRLVRYNPPVAGWEDDGAENGRRGVDGVRVDDGVYEGGEVSMFYDPMIAKLITWGPTRDAAADKQIEALDAFEIEGLGHNIDFVSAIMQHPRFRSGELTTGFIAEEYPDGFHGAATGDELKQTLAALAGFLATARSDRARRVDQQLGDELDPPYEWSVKIGDSTFAVTLDEDEVTVNGKAVDLALEYTPGDRLVHCEIDDTPLSVKVEPTRAGFKLTTRGAIHKVQVLPAHMAPYTQHMIEKIPPDLSKFLICPMPGLLVTLNVGEGDTVEAGQPLAVVEAMKMENILRAEKSGRVKSVNAKAGDSLAVDAIILEME